MVDKEKEKNSVTKEKEFHLGKKVFDHEDGDDDQNNGDDENVDENDEDDDNGENDGKQMDNDHEDDFTKNKAKTQAEIDKEQRRLNEVVDFRTSYMLNGSLFQNFLSTTIIMNNI